MKDTQNLAFVKKYNYKKNYIIFLVCNLPIAILGPMLLALWVIGLFDEVYDSFRAFRFRVFIWCLWILVIILAIIFSIMLIRFAFIFYGNRKKQEEIFNKKTPENYIVYNESSRSLTICSKKYFIKDIINVDFSYIKKYDILHFASANASKNGIVKNIPQTTKGRSSCIERMSKHSSKKKTNVGDLMLILKNNTGIFLQRILDIENVYNTLNNLISKN